MNGARFVIIEFPHSTDSWGIIQTEYGMPSAPPIEIGTGTTTNDATRRPINPAAGPTRNPTGSSMSTVQTLDNLFTDVDSLRESEREGGPTLHLRTWKPIRDIVVTKVSQDYGWTEVFKDSDEAYYATTKTPAEQFLFNWAITLEKLNQESRLVDKRGHNYRMLDWTELREMTWKGKPLFSLTCPTTTIGPDDSAYNAETIVPPYAPPEATFTDWGKGRESPSQWDTYGDSHHVHPLMPRTEPLRLVMPVRPTPVVPYPIRPMPSGLIPRGPIPAPLRPTPRPTPARPLPMPMRPPLIEPVRESL